MREYTCIRKQQKQTNTPKLNIKLLDLPIRNYIDSLYKIIEKLKKRVVDKEKYISFLKTSLEEAGKDYKSEFIEYKRVLRQKEIDVFINTPARGKNYDKNKKKRNNKKKVVGSLIGRQDTTHEIVLKDQAAAEQKSAIDESFHSCVDDEEELQKLNEENGSQQISQVCIKHNDMEQEYIMAQQYYEYMKQQEDLKKRLEESARETELIEQQAYERYIQMIKEENEKKTNEASKEKDKREQKEQPEDLEEICTDKIVPSSEEPGKMSGRDGHGNNKEHAGVKNIGSAAIPTESNHQNKKNKLKKKQKEATHGKFHQKVEDVLEETEQILTKKQLSLKKTVEKGIDLTQNIFEAFKKK